MSFQAPTAARPARASGVQVRALFGKKSAAVQPAQPAKKAVDKAAEYERKRGFLSSTLSAFDAAEVRSKSDAELLYEAKYGDRGADGKMTREQYRALRRRVGGTAKDFWKTNIDVKGQYTDKGYVSSKQSNNAPILALGGLTLAAMVGTLALVS